MQCIHSRECPNFETDKCNSICPYYIYTHGINGKGGYWGRRNVPKNYENLFVDQLPEDAVFDSIKDYIKSLPSIVENGTGLYLYSNPTKDNQLGTGTGKTTSAITILNEFARIQSKRHTKKEIKLIHNPSLFVKASNFQNKYNAQFRGTKEMQIQASICYYKFKQSMMDVQLLVLDDIAIRNMTEAFQNEMYEIIDHRETEGLATIYTSNISLKKLSNFYDDRIVSRIAGQCIAIPFTGIDHRRKKVF